MQNTHYPPQFLLQRVEQGLILHHGVGGGLAGVYEALVHIDNLRGCENNLRSSENGLRGWEVDPAVPQTVLGSFPVEGGLQEAGVPLFGGGGGGTVLGARRIGGGGIMIL